MATLYDRNGNEAHFPDEEVEARLAETWTVHRKTEPRWFAENPDKRTDAEKAKSGAQRVVKRARARAENLIESGALESDELSAWVSAEVSRVKSAWAGSPIKKLAAISEVLP